MPGDLTKTVLSAVKRLRDDVHETLRPPAETVAPHDQPIVPHSLVRGTRGYIESIAYQINACYLATAYDGCAVMMRRLLEVLIIESFEHKGIGQKIKDSRNDYFLLGDLVVLTLSESTWSLGRTTKKALSQLKEVGDRSAHSRRYNARRQYIDELIDEYRVVVEEFLYLSGLK